MNKFKNRTGAALLAIIIIVVLAIVILGTIFFYRHLAVAPTLSQPPAGTGTSQSTTTPLNPTPSSTVPTTTEPIIESISPISGPAGTLVTIHGSGFAPIDTIFMNNLVGGSMKSVASSDGKTLSFIVPQSLGPNCQPDQACPQFLELVIPNQYKISVLANGTTTQENIVFTVTAK